MKKIVTKLFSSPPKKTNSQTIYFFWSSTWLRGQVFLSNSNWLISLSFSFVILVALPLAYWLANRNFGSSSPANYFSVCTPLFFNTAFIFRGCLAIF